VLVLVDPLLVWSVGFWLSVTATLGVTVAAPWIASRLAGPTWFVGSLSVTLGAQVGVMVPSWLVFGRLPTLGVPANLLAVPAAGAVMSMGVPVALVASVLPARVAGIVMAPAAFATHWVATVAALAAALEPRGAAIVAAWAAQGAVIAVSAIARTRRR
jgi:competence protein ComEC